MKRPNLPKRPIIPLSDGEILIGRAVAFAEHRGNFLIPSEIVATNRRVALSTSGPSMMAAIRRLVILWIVGLVLFVSGANVLGGLTWLVGFAALIANTYYATPHVLEEFPLDSVVFCTSENELSMFKALRVTLVFASGTRWRLRPKQGLLYPRDYLASILRRAGLVMTERK